MRPVFLVAALVGLAGGPAGAQTPPGAPAFPLKRVAGSRWLADRDGRPFLVLGDTPWVLPLQLDRESARRYLDLRKAQGFNAILVNLIEHFFGSHPPTNVHSEGPFLRPGDFAAPNDAYFARVEALVEDAAARGIVVFMTPAYLGYDGGQEGWYQEMKALPVETLRGYGRYVATRFRRFDNIVWVHGGDFQPADHAIFRAVLDGIRETEPKWLHTYHGHRRDTAAEYLGPGEDWLGINTVYTAESVLPYIELARAKSRLPFVLIEGKYEGQAGVVPAVFRRQAYQTYLSGAAGHFAGFKAVWRFLPGWDTAATSPGAKSMAVLNGLLSRLPWPEFTPDSAHRLVVGGYGVEPELTVAAASQTTALVYLPNRWSVSLDLGRLRGTEFEAVWTDPTNGREVPAGRFPAATHRFPHPGRNAEGADDWVLLIRPRP